MSNVTQTRFVVTDIETTGLSPQRNRITEVACVYVEDGRIVGDHRTLVNPEQFIPIEVQRLTGITNATVLSAPKGREIFPTVREWLHDAAAIVAHNASFDTRFLAAEFARHQLPPIEVRSICTARLARRVLPARKGWSLGNLAGYFGIRVQGRHTALGDATATAEALIRMLELLREGHDCQTLSDIVAFQFRTGPIRRSRPAHVEALQPVLTSLPSAPGVYRMIDRRGEILYVGKAKSLRDRVGSYFRAGATHPRKIAEMVRRVRSIEVEQTGSELGALLLEARLIHTLQPRYNTLQKRLRRYHFVRLDVADPYPGLTITREIDTDGAEYFGPFAGRDAANLVVDTLQRIFPLRECEGALRPNAATLPCIYHQIERCSGPCAGLESPEQYRTHVELARSFLSGSEDGILEALRSRMGACAERLEYEEAAILRDRIVELRRIFTGRRRVADSINDNNVIIALPAADARHREVFMIRFGRLVRQTIVGRRPPVALLRKLIREVYGSSEITPPKFDREEVDEIRIIAGYLNRYRATGRFVNVAAHDDLEQVLRRVLEMVYRRKEVAA